MTDKIIRILPHHAPRYLEVAELGWKPKDVLFWHDLAMEENGTDMLTKVASDPKQLVQIANSYDSICKMCPYNKFGKNFGIHLKPCDTYFEGEGDNGFAMLLGLADILEGEPVTSQEFLGRLRKCYEKSLLEKPDIFSKTKKVYSLFREEEGLKFKRIVNGALERIYVR